MEEYSLNKCTINKCTLPLQPNKNLYCCTLPKHLYKINQ